MCSGKKKGLFLTCVVEEGSDEGAVLEEGVGGGDVLKVTLFKQGVFEYHGLQLEIQKPTTKPEESPGALGKTTGPSFQAFLNLCSMPNGTIILAKSHWYELTGK